MRRLRDINSALPGLMLGIIVCGVISEIAGVFLVADKLNYTIGLWIGVKKGRRQQWQDTASYVILQ